MEKHTINDPKISFGIIVLNGKPFIEACLRSLYPHAYEIIVAEGASESAKEYARADGHSIDGTLEALVEFSKHEDPENKIKIVTNPRSEFWEGREQQSQAYANKATGDYLWQVDTDEFYRGEDIEKVRLLLKEKPEIDSLSVRWLNFWGDQNTVVDGWFLKRGGGMVHRIFKWGKGYQYKGHWTGPHSVNLDGMRSFDGVYISGDELLEKHGVFCFHYSLLFPKQVQSKMSIYEDDTDPTYQYKNASDWVENNWLTLSDPWHVHGRKDEPSWLEPYQGTHPKEASKMLASLDKQKSHLLRDMTDVNILLKKKSYQIKRSILSKLAPISKRFGDSVKGYWFSQVTNKWLENGLIGPVNLLCSLALKKTLCLPDLKNHPLGFLSSTPTPYQKNQTPNQVEEALTGIRTLPKAIAFDLDNTVLLVKEHSEIPEDSVKESTWTLPISGLRKTWHSVPSKIQNTKLGWKTRQLLKHNLPAVSEPTKYIQLSPGIIDLLKALKGRGTKIYLITAGNEKRVRHLMHQFPQLKTLFDGVTARKEQFKIHKHLSKQTSGKKSIWENFHQTIPMSLANKTPLISKYVFGVEYDLLIDDSEETKEIFKKSNQQHKFFHWKPESPVDSLKALLVHLGATSDSLKNVTISDNDPIWYEDALYNIYDRKSLLIKDSELD